MTAWRKSSFSGADSNCVEIAFYWRKSSFSAADANCVEIAHTTEAAAIRDSKNPNQAHLVLTPTAYRGLLLRVRT